MPGHGGPGGNGGTDSGASGRERAASEELLAGPLKFRGLWKPALLAAFLVASLVCFRLFGLDARIVDLHAYIKSLGSAGVAVFALVCVAWALAMIPATILQVLAGALFGPWLGTVIYTIAYTAGTILCFLIARYAARKPVQSLLTVSPRLRRLMALADRHDTLVVALLRLMPLSPTNTVNYVLGITNVRFGVYAFWSLFGMIPITFLVVAGGDVFVNGFDRGSDWIVAVSAGATAALLAATIWLTRRNLKAQRRAIKAASRAGDAAAEAGKSETWPGGISR